MATLTSTTFANLQPKAPHVGNTSVSGTFNSGATAVASGDVIFLAKIPNGAVIVDFREDHSTGATQCAVKFGLANGHPTGGAPSFSCIIATANQATVNRASVVNSSNLNISLSANDTVGYGILAAKSAGTTTTTSLIINFVLSYRVDGN